MQFFKKSPEEIRIENKLKRIQEAQQEEKHRAPNPIQGSGQWIKLHTYRFPPKQQPKAIVFMFHGLCAHINHGAHIAEKMADAGYLVVGFDHRGFGKSEGLRGYLENLETHLHDSRAFVEKVVNQIGNPQIPIFLTGLSMGGMTSFRLAIQGNIPNLKGIILFAPAIRALMGFFQIGTINLMGKFMPKMKFIKPKRGQTTKNPQVTEELYNDPYTFKDEFFPRTLATITSSMKESESMYGQLKTPWIVIQGGLDKLVDPDLAYLLEKDSPSTDKTVIFYENLWHDVWHEQEIHEIIPKIITWINQRV